uniref:ATP-dependent RNA helicase n=1 Tax=Oncorhynchus kisutch TaxID=8019 RepID=A0A8C7D713_ONCKI
YKEQPATLTSLEVPSYLTDIEPYMHSCINRKHLSLKQTLPVPKIHASLTHIHFMSTVHSHSTPPTGRVPRAKDFAVHQWEVIPVILENVSWSVDWKRGYKPRNICVSAPTGSGKTGIRYTCCSRGLCDIRVLTVLPTKELAQQVTRGTSLKVVIIAGQKFFAKEQASVSETQGGTSHSLADIVVATPGRLVDHINKFGIPPLPCGSLIQADRMIDSMHQSWLSQVTKAVYRSKRESREQCVTVVSFFGEYYVPCTLSKRPLLILHFILCLKFSPILCFTNSRESAHRLCLLVQLFSGVQAAESLNRERLLTSTDAAARGIVINGVKCVVNYEAPQFFRMYIYLCWKRVGKTARAGKVLTKQNKFNNPWWCDKVQNGKQEQGENRWYSRLDELATDRTQVYSALRKYSAPLNFATFCHISGFKHKDIKLYFL